MLAAYDFLHIPLPHSDYGTGYRLAVQFSRPNQDGWPSCPQPYQVQRGNDEKRQDAAFNSPSLPRQPLHPAGCR